MKSSSDPTTPLTVESYKDAVVVPTTSFPRPKRKNAMKMGVVDRRGRVVRLSQLWRSYGRMGFPPDITSTSRSDGREVIYVGHLPPHFGHFILEGLSRLWFAAQHPELPIVWACRSEEPATGYTRWQRQLLEVLGVENEPIFLAEPWRFAKVHVPEAGYRIKDYFSEQLARFLAVYPARQREPGAKIWLSRAGVGSEHGSVYATRLDEQLAEHGWGVIHPERLPISKQLELLATASRVAAEEGSALHLVVLLADVSGLEVDVLCRRPDRSSGGLNANYLTIAAARGFTQRLHVIPEELVLGEDSGHVTKVSTTLAGHLEALGIPRAEDGEAQARPAAAVVAELTHGADAYLELGTGRDGLYDAVDARLRHVVRPSFRSDPRVNATPGLQRFEMPFDEFFEYDLTDGLRYDVIVLDGFRSSTELEQWYGASATRAHGGTTWILLARSHVLKPLEVSMTPRSRLVSTDEGPCLVVEGSLATSTP